MLYQTSIERFLVEYTASSVGGFIVQFIIIVITPLAEVDLSIQKCVIHLNRSDQLANSQIHEFAIWA